MHWVPIGFYVLCCAWAVWFYLGAEADANDNG